MARIRVELILSTDDDLAEELKEEVEGSLNECLAVTEWMEKNEGAISFVAANVEVS